MEFFQCKRVMYSGDRTSRFAIGDICLVEKSPQYMIQAIDGLLTPVTKPGRFHYKIINLDKDNATVNIKGTTNFKTRFTKLRTVPPDYRILLEKLLLDTMGYRNG